MAMTAGWCRIASSGRPVSRRSAAAVSPPASASCARISSAGSPSASPEPSSAAAASPSCKKWNDALAEHHVWR